MNRACMAGTGMVLGVFGFWVAPAVASNPPTQHKSGISLDLEGKDGEAYAFERLYFDPLVDDQGVFYIKGGTRLRLSHNANNSRPVNKGAYGTGCEVIGSEGGGIIRYKIDRDLQLKKHAWSPFEKRELLPEYQGPLSFAELKFDPSTPVLGSTGPVPGVPVGDRLNYYYRGLVDAAGDEWHWMGWGDDDAALNKLSNLEWNASDGKSALLVVNPQTPALYCKASGPGAQYYTTPAKVYFVPKIHEQTTYLTSGVDIGLVNIMDGKPVFYRIDDGPEKEYTGPIPAAQIPDGRHILSYRYLPGVVKKRILVKNPESPSKVEKLEDGTGHGYLLWKNDREFNLLKARLLSGSLAGEYKKLKDELKPGLDWTGGAGLRCEQKTGALGYALVHAVEGGAEYGLAAKRRLLNSKWFTDPVGFELADSFEPQPSREINYRGYYDVNEIFELAFAYDLLAKNFRSDSEPGGLTPIEELRIRDMLALFNLESLVYLGLWTSDTDSDLKKQPPTAPREGMWHTARQIGSVVVALAMPGYDTPYYGTSGFDGRQASHPWTPYPDYPESWKDVYVTYTDETKPEHAARVHEFPNRVYLWNWHRDGLVKSDGLFHDRNGYYSYHLMGHCFHILSNVMKRRLSHAYPFLELSYVKSNEGAMYGLKKNGPTDGKPQWYSQLLLINGYFPNVAQGALDAIVGGKIYRVGSTTRISDLEDILYQAGVYRLVWYNPDWKSEPAGE